MEFTGLSRRLSLDIGGTLGSLIRHLILPTIRILLGSTVALLGCRLLDSCASTNGPCHNICIPNGVKRILIYFVVRIEDTFSAT